MNIIPKYSMNNSYQTMYTPIKIMSRIFGKTNDLSKNMIIDSNISNKVNQMQIKSNHLFFKNFEKQKYNRNMQDKGTSMYDFEKNKTKKFSTHKLIEKIKDSNSYLILITNYKNHNNTNFNFDFTENIKKSQSLNYVKKKNTFTYNFIRDTQKSKLLRSRNTNRKANLTSTAISNLLSKTERLKSKNITKKIKEKKILVVNNLKQKYFNKEKKTTLLNNSMKIITNKTNNLYKLEKKEFDTKNIMKFIYRMKLKSLHENRNFNSQVKNHEIKNAFEHKNKSYLKLFHVKNRNINNYDDIILKKLLIKI